MSQADQLTVSGPAAITSVGTGVGAVVVDPSVYWLGVPLPVVLAAVAGAALALSLVGEMTRRQAFLAWALGSGFGTYVPPLLGWWPGIPPAVWPALGFILGLLAHMCLTALFHSAPGAIGGALSALIDRIRGR